MSTLIRQGDTLPLSLQLPDGVTTKYPQADIYGASGGHLTTVDLVHRATGLYTVDTEAMPAEDFVTVVYTVYDDAGHTIVSGSYNRTSEVFVAALFVVLTDGVDGSITVQAALARANAAASGRVVRTMGNRYEYRNNANSAPLFTNIDNDTERTPL